MPEARAGLDDVERSPHRHLVGLAVPVLASLLAEPVTGLVDTAFVARLGAAPLAALGVGTILLSSVLWIFNFLGIGTQTEVARGLGGDGEADVGRALGTAWAVAAVVGFVLAGLGLPLLGPAAEAMGANGEIRSLAVTYLALRLPGVPATLLTIVAFGALRGARDMRTPLVIAVATNVLNLVLDPLLIFGLGPVPALGVAGAALASTAAQWTGAIAALVLTARRLGPAGRPTAASVRGLFVVGRDLFLRTGLLVLFLALSTRAATRLGAESGAAHQAVRQVWTTAALVLDAFAVAAQSLVGWSIGANRLGLARRLAGIAVVWSVGAGVLVAAGMLATTELFAVALVPTSAHALFGSAWIWAAVAQPLNALAFATDGVHWATRDYRWLRDAVGLATLVGAAGLAVLPGDPARGLAGIWIVTAVWIAIRAGLGAVRVWPGVGAAPLGRSAARSGESQPGDVPPVGTA